MSYLGKSSLPEKYVVNQVSYRSLGGCTSEDNELGCGFLIKKPRDGGFLRFRKYGILWLLQGRGEYVDEEGRRIMLRPGDCVQRLPGGLHYTPVLPSEKIWVECFITFGTPLFNVLKNLGMLYGEHPVFHSGLNFVLVESFMDLSLKLQQASEFELPHLLSRAQNLVFELYRMAACSGNTGKHEKEISQACTLLAINLQSREDTEKILEDLPISYESLRKCFKEKIGLSPGAYRLSRRLERARELLHTTDEQIKVIAYELGYPDSYAFTRQFTSHVGMSPTRFRKQM